MTSLASLFRELQLKYQSGAPTGVVATDVAGVHFFWATQPQPRTPLLYGAGILIVGQGFKIIHLGDQRIRYDAETLLVLGMPLPLEASY